jgi:hypothetical protein
MPQIAAKMKVVITAADLTMNLTPTSPDVIGQNFSAEIFLGRATVTGTATVYLRDQGADRRLHQRNRAMNYVLWLIGVIVVILVVLGFFGLR